MSWIVCEEPPRASPMARWDARWKLAGVGAVVVAAAVVHRLDLAAVALGVSVALLFLARVTLRDLAARYLPLGFSLALPAILLPFTAEDGLHTATLMIVRAFAIAGCALAVLRSASVARTCAAAGRLGVPSSLVQIAQFALRYAVLFRNEFNRLRIALRLRGFAPAMSVGAARTVGATLGTLFVHGLDRSERVAEAMRSRGFDGRLRELEPFRTRPADVAAFAVAFLIAIGLVVWDRFA